MTKHHTMNDRLKLARIAAGFDTATAAIERHYWNATLYRHHENGKSSFSRIEAKNYAYAYNVSADWLLFGDNSNLKISN